MRGQVASAQELLRPTAPSPPRGVSFALAVYLPD